MFPPRGHRNIGVAFQSNSVRQALSQEEAKDFAVLSSRHTDILEPTEWPKGSQASFVAWREDWCLLCMPCS